MNQNQLNISELEKAYEARAKEIFNDLNIGPIVFYLNRLIPSLFPLVKSDEFSTIVSCAEIDGMKILIEKVKESVVGGASKQRPK